MNWYEQDKKSLLEEFGSNPETGLDSSLIVKKQQKFGKNQFDEQKSESVFKKILHNLRDAPTIILISAATISLIMAFAGDGGKGLTEFFVIIGIVILNMTLAITQERGAEKALNALKSLSSPTSIVLRDGKQQEINSVDLVPGDIIILRTGDSISADARLLEVKDFMSDESILTGESAPVEKSASVELVGKVATGDQINMVFSGCLVTAGRAKALVVATGMNTQMGHIAEHLNDVKKLRTPLQTRLDGVGKVISLIAVVAAVIVFSVEISRGAEVMEMLFVAVALAVAAVPETMSLIVTLILTRGVTEMVKKNALIRKLVAVETLGSTSVICTDKTGTLTQNQMAIKRLWRAGSQPFEDTIDFSEDQMFLLDKLTLSSNAVAEEKNGRLTIIGDPTETAILRLFNAKGGNREKLEKKYPEVAEIPFSSERKMMTTIHAHPKGGYLVLVKGAFDRVPFEKVSSTELKERQEMHDAFARDALRVIALGSKHVDKLPDEKELGKLEKDLKFEGIIGIIDPPRPEVAKAIAVAKEAGIRTIMITGDHAVTAKAIAEQVGLLAEGGQVITGMELSEISDEELKRNITQYCVYARVSPEDKIRIVEAWQEHNEVVAMTGDGVNDAPALKSADVGVAMGITGTEVSKSAADMILTDDNFATIVSAIHRGRGVYHNIRKTVYYLLSCNFSEISLMLLAQMLGWGLPLTPIMILLINVVGVGVPGLFLAREKPELGIMKDEPVKRGESIFKGLVFRMGRQTAAFVVAGLVGYYIGTFINISELHPPSYAVGQTLAFLIIGWTAILHIFTARSEQSIFRSRLKNNPMLAVGAFAMILLFASFVAVPIFNNLFGVVAISLKHWLLAIGLSLIPTIVAEIGKLFKKRVRA